MNAKLSRCATIMRKRHKELVSALINGFQNPRKNRFAEPEDVFEARVSEELELFIRYIEGNEYSGALYSGLCIFEQYEPEHSITENIETSRIRFKEDAAILVSNLSPFLTPEELVEFKSAFTDLTSAITTPPIKHIRTLFIGDCLMMEIMSFLVPSLMAKGVSIDPFPINSRDPQQLRNIISSLASKEFDVIFVSPFSHNRLPEIKLLLNPTNLLSTSELNTTVQSILEQTKLLLDFLSDRFECPIYIHNALLIPRSTSLIKTVVRLSLTWRMRLFAKSRINEWIANYIADTNSTTFQHLFLLDENSLIKKFGRFELSRFLHTSKFQHATVLSQKLSFEYNERISTIADLFGKKLIICDFDSLLNLKPNDEKKLIHFHKQQLILKNLLQHGGIVLSIVTNYKKSELNFNHEYLNSTDFVAPKFRITNKIKAIDSIKNELNLQTRHMVFLNDNESDLDLVKRSYPEILTLKSSDTSVWNRMQLWADNIYDSSDIDRTKLYREQAKRDKCIEHFEKVDNQNDFQSLKKLGLIITIHEAKKNDLKRIVELINRTNQWNLCGSRTNLEQIQTWHTSKNACILVASAKDRFGDMGVVCIAVTNMNSGDTSIPIFVLSCRVFGYGVETAMLNEIIKRCKIGNKKSTLTGYFTPTNQNHLSRNMYCDHGFKQLNGKFILDEVNTMTSIPWAEVNVI